MVTFIHTELSNAHEGRATAASGPRSPGRRPAPRGAGHQLHLAAVLALLAILVIAIDVFVI